MLIPSLMEECGDREAWARDLLSRLDGLMLAGNPSNIHPRHYGQTEEPHHPPYDEPRDELALLLARPAFAYSPSLHSSHARRDRVAPFATVPFVWRSHAKAPAIRAGRALDIALRLE